MQHWLLLAAAIVLEVAGTTFMKLSYGFTRLVPSLLVVVFYAGSFLALALCLKKLEVSVTYAIWAGVGTALVALIGAVYFHEPMPPMKLASLALIIIGVVGLHLGGTVPLSD